MTRRPSKLFVTALITTAVAGAMLSACGGEDPYCAAVTEHQKVLNSFGDKRTDAGFTSYGKAAKAIGAVAPDTVKQDWTTLASVTTGVLAAHQKVGIPLEDMTDPAKVEALSSDDLKRLNTAYDAFNDTAAQRKAVVADVKTACDITLK